MILIHMNADFSFVDMFTVFYCVFSRLKTEVNCILPGFALFYGVERSFSAPDNAGPGDDVKIGAAGTVTGRANGLDGQRLGPIVALELRPRRRTVGSGPFQSPSTPLSHFVFVQSQRSRLVKE